jgi:hypothetical protein
MLYEESIESPTRGNGHQKAFELTTPKTPEQLAREGAAKLAPKLRRAVREMQLDPQVKFLFDAILDDTFMFNFGGDGRGRMFASIRDLAERYGHDRDSITKWAAKLIEKEVLWMGRSHPDQEWRITALCPAPDRKAEPRQKVRAMASAAADRSNAEDTRIAPLSSQVVDDPRKTEGNRTIRGHVPASNAEDTRTTGGTLPPDWRVPSAQLAEPFRQLLPIPSASGADTPRQTGGSLPPVVRAPSARSAGGEGTGPQSGPIETGGSATLEMSPGNRIRDQGKGGGNLTPPKNASKGAFSNVSFDSWRKKLEKLFPRELKEQKQELTRRLGSIKGNAKSMDWQASPLDPRIQEWVAVCDQEIAELGKSQAPQDKHQLLERRTHKAEILRDPKSYTELKLTAAAASQVELIKRKLAAIDEAMHGPTT